METDESIGPHAEVETFLNYVSIYNNSVKKLLAQPPMEPGIHYHLGIVQITLAIEALLSRLYLEFIFSKLPNTARDNLERHPAESRWYIAPLLIQILRGKDPKFFDKGKMPFQGLAELIKFRNAAAHPPPDFRVTGKVERPFLSDGDSNDHLPRRKFWDKKEWPILRIHMHPEFVSREELERAYNLFLSLISELDRLTDHLITLEWATVSVFKIKALIA